MADQTAPPAAAAPAQSSGYDLHKCALDAEKANEKLATELAHAGFDKSATRAVTQMAEACRKIASAVAKQQDSEGRADQASEPAGEPVNEPAAPHTMASATDSLMSDVRARRGA